MENEELLINATELFIGDNGVRTTNNANEIAHYEYGAALACDCVLDAMNLVDEGVSELEFGDALQRYGQHTTITTIAATGERFVNGNMFPINRKVKIGDPISLTVGFAGGSSSRGGYAVENQEQLNEGAKDYMEKLAKPYFSMYASWLENIKSGMIFQIDIIPSMEGMSGVSAESTVVLADQKLKDEIKEQYSDMWERMMERKEYMRSELNIQLSEDVLPMCSTVGY